MEISESDLRKIIREKIKDLIMDDALFKNRNPDGLHRQRDIPGDADEELNEPLLGSGPMTPEEQQEEFDRLVDAGNEPEDLKATGKYPLVDSLSSDVADRYFKRKYGWLKETKD